MCPGLAVCLEAVHDRVVSINFELLKVKDIVAEGSFKKKKSILSEVLLVIFFKSLDLGFDRKNY